MFEFFYRRPHLLGAIIGGLLLTGVLGLLRMPKNLFPDASRPEVVIFASLPGANPESIATAVVKPIEEEMATLNGVYEIKSTSVPNFGIIKVVFNYSKGLEEGAVDVVNGLNRIRGKLPSGVTTSIYLVGDFTMPVDLFAVTPKEGSGLSLAEVRKIVENYIKPRLLISDQIGNVEVFGGYQQALTIKVDPRKLAQYNIPITLLIKKLRSFRDIPIGFQKGEGRFWTLTFYGSKKELTRVKNLPITETLKLGDLAKVEWGTTTFNSLYIGNGKPAIALSIQRAPGGSVLDTSRAVRKILKEVEREYPNLSFSLADTQVNLVETSNKNMLEALRDAILFTLIVLLFFLGNFRALLAAGLSIPLVFLGTIGLLYLTGHSLNIVVYTGIILALGMLTDDAVVVLENIERHLEEGDSNPIFNGTKEVLGPIFAGTFATIAIVFPMTFVGGFPEQIFRQLVTTLIIALLLSWFLSITFIPKLASYLYRGGKVEKSRVEKWFNSLYSNTLGRLVGGYQGILKFTNRPPYLLRRLLLIGGAIGVLALSLRTTVPLIGRDVMPPMDTGIIKVKLEFSSNLNSEESGNRLKPFLQWLTAQPWYRSSSIGIGTERGVLSVGGGGGGNSVMMTILAVDRFHRRKSIWELEGEIREKLAQLRGVKQLAVFDFGATALSTISAPLDIKLLSDRFENLPAEGERVQKLLSKVPGLTTLFLSWNRDLVEGELKLDWGKLAHYKITPAEVVAQLALRDQVVSLDTRLSTMDPIPVIIRYSGEFGKNLESLRLLPIVTPVGVVPLEELGRIEPHFTYTKIDRYNLQYGIDVEGYRAKFPVSIITGTADKILKESGVQNYLQAGDIREMTDSFKRLIGAIGIGVVFLILTLMVIYRSLKLALVMIVVLPLSMIGGSWGMLIAHKPSCMPSIVGLLLLFGIIIKNSVLLVDFYHNFREKGEKPFEAALESIRYRFRPVMMTAFGTIAGMLPVALEWAVGLERLSPLADVAVGGLLVGTLLTLVYVPLLAYWTDRGR
ncbi:MAG: efflux RND transporter permease subunit [Campylobacterales bacterium]